MTAPSSIADLRGPKQPAVGLGASPLRRGDASETARARVRKGPASSGETALPTDVVEAGGRRLVLAVLLYAFGSIVSQVATGFAHLFLGVAPPPGGFVLQSSIALASLFVAGVVAWLLSSGRLSVRRHPEIATVIEVAGAVGILASELGGGLALDGRPFGVSRAAVWIVLFPLIVPRPTSRAAYAALWTAATAPAALAIAWWHDGSLPPAGNVFMWLVPFAMSAALGIAVSRIVHGLGREVARARQMGSYRLVSRIGAGGMGEVWRAEHRLLARPAAVKLVQSDKLGRADVDAEVVLRRFEREAMVTSSLRSVHTVALYDFGVTDDGALYYAMELLEGLDAETLVARFGPLEAGRAIHVLRQVCLSLAEAHEIGLIHRDIKPANIHVGRAGVEDDFVKVLDFGLVRPALSSGDVRLTAEGTMSGTPAYMAPEVITGRSDLDARLDLYALGCVAYWLLTGERVFDAKDAMAVVIHHATTQPTRPSERTELPIPGELEALVMQLLAKDPDARPSSAREVARRLAACAEATPWTSSDAERWWQTHQPRVTDPTVHLAALAPKGATA